jgi:hypothetical protein
MKAEVRIQEQNPWWRRRKTPVIPAFSRVRIHPGNPPILKQVSLPKRGHHCSIGLRFSGAAPVDRQE